MKKGGTATPLPEAWKPSDDTIARLKTKGYDDYDLEARLHHFLPWARTADRCKDWDAVFEKAVLANWAKLSKPTASISEIVKREEEDSRRRAVRDQRAQEANARLIAERPELARRDGEGVKDYVKRTMGMRAETAG